jgi:hypothetical protein
VEHALGERRPGRIREAESKRFSGWRRPRRAGAGTGQRADGRLDAAPVSRCVIRRGDEPCRGGTGPDEDDLFAAARQFDPCDGGRVEPGEQAVRRAQKP